ncbi:MAG: hypothetical protein GY717_14635 [Rhodobacteraceae bacterium]|nr:hypothetical protein [Paracoccaceae bacterium]
MKKTIIAAVVTALAGGAALADGPPPGCYHRDYTDAHLAKHPNQVVDWITMIVEHDQYGHDVARMRVYTANQGHVRRSGHGHRVFDQFLFCWDDGRRARCGVECDGGGFVMTRYTGKSLTFETRNLWIGDTDECGGAIDLAEIPGRAVKYRLDRVSASICHGL